MNLDEENMGCEAAWFPKPLGNCSICNKDLDNCLCWDDGTLGRDERHVGVAEEMIDHHEYDSLGG